MAQQIRHVDISDLQEVPAWEHLVEEVRDTKQPAIIRSGGEDLAELRPAKPKGRSRLPRGKRTSEDDPFWGIVGTARSDAPSNVSEHVDESLAEARMGKPE